MKVVHVTPTYFDDSSLIGGGERYVTELASRMADRVETTLVSFSKERKSYRRGNLQIEVYPVQHFIRGSRLNPFSLRYLNAVRRADIVHCHQIYTLISDLACLLASWLRKPAFVTDHGGGGDFFLSSKLPVFNGYCHVAAQSQFGITVLPDALKPKAILLKGGIDTQRFCPDPTLPKENIILCVARILPHKGTNYLIDAFRQLNRSDYTLQIIGRVYHEAFYDRLKQQAEGLQVEFVHDADDDRVLQAYRTAKVNVLASVHTDCYGSYTPVPELMGFTLLEAQACGTPVICTDAGAMSEFVDAGRTGQIAAQNSGESLAAALDKILSLSPEAYAQVQNNCLDWVKPLAWERIVQQLLELYARSL